MSTLPKILLHICCAPDATACVEQLAPSYEVIGYFYNPNIYPPAEYERRLANAEKVAAAQGFTLSPSVYEPETWQEAVRGWEAEPERGRRCDLCFAHNLEASAAKAGELGIKVFTSTLTISPHKNCAKIFAAGNMAAELHGVQFLALDFKKRDGFKRSLEWSRELNLYRQNYCGCRYSRRITQNG